MQKTRLHTLRQSEYGAFEYFFDIVFILLLQEFIKGVIKYGQ